MKFFNYDSPFWSFMSRIADLVIVNILWLVFCIPVFTIGASTAAMYRVTLNLVRGEGGGVVRSFWASFKLNFKQGVLLFLILLIPTLLVIVEVEIYLSGAVAQSVWMGVIFCFPALLVSLVGAYIYPLLAAVRQYHQEHTQKRHSAFDRQPPLFARDGGAESVRAAPAPVCDKLFPADVHFLDPDRRFARRDAQFISAAENLQKVF